MAAATTTSRAPDARFLVAHPAHFIALGFGAGLAPRAPGTFGTLLGWAIFLALFQFLAPLVIAFLAIPLFFLGIWACDVTGRALGVVDSGAIVWDEVVAFLVVLFFVGAHPLSIMVAFGLFRLFDILKPPPIRQLERAFKNGFGVMADDLLAAGYTLLVFSFLHRIVT